MKKFPFLLISSLAIVAAASAQTVVIQDTFSGPLTDDIDNRVPDIVQSAGDAWSRDNAGGTRTQVGGGILYLNEATDTKGFAKAALEFDPSVGVVASNPYTLSFSIAFNPGSATGVTWYGGFGNATGAGGTFSDFAGGPMFNFTGDTTGTSFTLRAGVSPFANTLTTTISRATTADLYSVDLAIRIDPLAASDNVEFYVDNAFLGSITYTGNRGGIWIKTDGWSAATATGMRISNFQLTAVPEPSTWMLLGLGAVALWALRRQRTRRA